jgi:hypothetical protein
LRSDGLRIILAATNHLHEDIAVLRNRIRLLESALEVLHVERTGQTHPLLDRSPEEDWDDDDILSTGTSESGDCDVIDDDGTLAFDPDGASRIFGSSGHALVYSLSAGCSSFGVETQTKAPSRCQNLNVH